MTSQVSLGGSRSLKHYYLASLDKLSIVRQGSMNKFSTASGRPSKNPIANAIFPPLLMGGFLSLNFNEIVNFLAYFVVSYFYFEDTYKIALMKRPADSISGLIRIVMSIFMALLLSAIEYGAKHFSAAYLF